MQRYHPWRNDCRVVLVERLPHLPCGEAEVADR
jgi:hypothetical protein